MSKPLRITIYLVAGLVLLVSLVLWANRERADARQRAIRDDVQKYLDAWIVGDYHTMYYLLSQQTRQHISEVEFIRRFQENQRRFARPIRVIHIRVLSDKGRSDIARVEYTIETLITEERAAQLRQLGEISARAGPHISTTMRIFVRQEGRWKMYILPHS
jgi:hypothetical protein